LTRPRAHILRAAVALLLGAAIGPALAASDPVEDVVGRGGAGVGLLSRIERSPYRGIGLRQDLMPLYVYEGGNAYLRSYRVGLKFDAQPWRLDFFLTRRFEGTPYGLSPDELPGVTPREQGADVGVGFAWRGARQQSVYVEAMRDATAVSHGGEVRLGYKHEFGAGRLRLRPHLMLGWRNSALNNYYYGVSPAEAAPGRPAYEPGAGGEVQLDLYAIYRLPSDWVAIGGLTLTRRASGVRNSPIVENRVQPGVFAGLMYDFSPQTRKWPEGRPAIARVFYGASSECDMLQIVRLACTSTHTQDPTNVAGYELGRPLVQRLNGWPLDIAVLVGLVRHKEYGLQGDFWQVNGYIKAYYYGLPWSHRVNTRLGFGAGLSYARRVPIMEQRDQAVRGRDTSRLLNYMDPTIDVSLGDLVGSRRLRDTFVGLGVSHRSGIFGSSQLFGNVNGGSNYIYSYVETVF
jgi:MipA family protein